MPCTGSHCHESEGKSRCDFIYCNYEHSLLSIRSLSLSLLLSLPLHSHAHFISEHLAVCVLISFALPNQQTYEQIHTHTHSVTLVRSLAPVQFVVHLAIKLETLLFQCSKLTVAAQSNGRERESEKVKRVINLIKFQMRNATSKIGILTQKSKCIPKMSEGGGGG